MKDHEGNGLNLVALVVEDEVLISIDIEDALMTNGIRRMHCSNNYDDAEAWLAYNTPDIAVIDIVLRGEIRATVADTLAEREVMTLVYSGLPHPKLFEDSAFMRFPVLGKPAPTDELSNAIGRLVDIIVARHTLPEAPPTPLDSDRPVE